MSFATRRGLVERREEPWQGVETPSPVAMLALSAKLTGIWRTARSKGFFNCSSRKVLRRDFAVGGEVYTGLSARAANEFALALLVGDGMKPSPDALTVRMGVSKPSSSPFLNVSLRRNASSATFLPSAWLLTSELSSSDSSSSSEPLAKSRGLSSPHGISHSGHHQSKLPASRSPQSRPSPPRSPSCLS